MNVLEDQVTDLNSLAGSPLPHLAAAAAAAASSVMSMSMSGSPALTMAESPVVEGGIEQHHHHHHQHFNDHNNTSSGGAASASGNNNAKKRKSIAAATSGGGYVGEDASTPVGNANGVVANGEQKRAKRNRYISIACNECKRRKIKCNGETPCLRCGNLNLECQYAPNCCTNGGFKESDEFRQMNAHIKSLQEQVDNLYANLSAMKNDPSLQSSRHDTPNQGFVPQQERPMSHGPLPPMDPVPRYRPIPKHPFFRGPTSTAFSLDVAKNTLHNMGYQGLVDENVATHDPTPVASPPPGNSSLQLSNLLENPSRDPLWTFSKEEMVRLCRLYEEEVGVMYPIVDIEMVVAHGRHLHKYSANIKTNTSNGQLQNIRDVETCVLKLVLAIASITENSGHSEIGDSLFETVRETADRLLHTEAVDVKTLPFLVLVAIYHFHCDEEGLAWRIIGQIARMSIELGLHRRDSFFKVVTTEPDRAKALRLFWSIYVLDRRWSFGTGLPFALQDSDIDPNLPEPAVDTPYLNVMIAYSRIGSKVWRSIASVSAPLGPSLNVEEIGYLDYQVLQWQKSIPPSLQLPHASSPAPTSRGLHRLQILLYLRANQMRILIYRPVLHSASSIQENMAYANIVVDLAKNTIRALTHLNQTTDIYQMQQVLFNYFLISALAVIFLASCHAPVHFSSLCRDEFYMALDLVKNFSNKSWVSKRLWKTIKGLKEVGPRLGLSSPEVSHHHLNNANVGEDAHSSAALAMAGLAGHEISGMYESGNRVLDGRLRVRVEDKNGSLNGSSPVDGFQMSTEMTNLFEAALGSASAGNGFTSTPMPDGMSVGHGGNGNGVGNVNGNGNGQGHGGAVQGSHAFGGDEELYRQLRDLF